MDIVFCGTPQFAVPTLDVLIQAGHNVRLVVTQPDKPVGREQQMSKSAVKQRAEELGLPIAQPVSIKNNPEFRAALEAIRPQAIVVVAYGRIIPKWMLDLPPLGNINAHASLLPKYRGAAPIQWAIANGERETDVTTMRINEGLDTGAMLLAESTPISQEDTAITLAPRLAAIGAELMVKTLAGLEQGNIHPRPQDDSQATLAPILKKEDGRIDFHRSAREVFNRLRGFQPWPGAFSSFRGKQFTIHAASPVTDAQHTHQAGALLVDGDRMCAGCGFSSVLELLEVQLEGKKRMPARDFIHGYKPQPGEMLGGG